MANPTPEKPKPLDLDELLISAAFAERGQLRRVWRAVIDASATVDGRPGLTDVEITIMREAIYARREELDRRHTIELAHLQPDEPEAPVIPQQWTPHDVLERLAPSGTDHMSIRLPEHDQ